MFYDEKDSEDESKHCPALPGPLLHHVLMHHGHTPPKYLQERITSMHYTTPATSVRLLGAAFARRTARDPTAVLGPTVLPGSAASPRNGPARPRHSPSRYGLARINPGLHTASPKIQTLCLRAASKRSLNSGTRGRAHSPGHSVPCPPPRGADPVAPPRACLSG